jgi:hypothetical protein
MRSGAAAISASTGVLAGELSWVLDRAEDSAYGLVARVYRVHDFHGEPRTVEEGCEVSWVHYSKLLEPQCSFRKYNENLFKHVGLL